MLPHAPEMMASLTGAVCVCSVLIEAGSWKAQRAQDPAPLGSTGVRTHSLLHDVHRGLIWAWGLSFQLPECRVPDELHYVWFFWHCGFSFFSTRSCAVPEAEISPVLSLNALAEFWRRYLAERRETFSLQDLRVSAWWGIQLSWCSSVHFLFLIAVCLWCCWSGKDSF